MVSPKLPSCWINNLQSWFVHIEAQFRTSGITKDSTKFDHVVQALPATLIDRILPFLLQPPKEDAYNKLKESILQITAISDKQRYIQLFREVTLGDQKPSHLLANMKKLCDGRQLDELFFKQMFLEKLPSLAQTILSVAPSGASLEELAAMADKAVEAQLFQPTVSSIGQQESSTNKIVLALSQQVADLVKNMAELKLQIRDRSRSSSRSSSLDRGRRSSRSPYREATEDTCWYHVNFGPKARQCRSPCKFSGNVPASQ